MDIYFGNIAEAEYTAHPLTLVDIGARGGLQPNWRKATRHLRVIGFEPDPEEFARLASKQERGRIYFDVALHGAPGEVALNLARSPGTSSLLEANHAFLSRFPEAERFEVVKQVRLRADTLDNVLAANDMGAVDFLKIDTQGAELAILQGARRTLAQHVFGVELEVNFGPLYVGQPTFGELDAFLRALGLQLIDLRPAYWKRLYGARFGGPKGQLVFGDALYFVTEERFQQRLADMAEVHVRRGVLLRAMSVCLLYGYVDYALELLRPNTGLFEPSIAAEIERRLRADVRVSTRVPHFRGRGLLSHVFYRLHRMLFPTYGGWASGGRNLGNID